MPQFGYKKGRLYMASQLVEDMFVLRGLNVDFKWALPIQVKVCCEGQPISGVRWQVGCAH